MVARGFHTPYVLVQFQCPQLWRCGGVRSPRYPVKVKIASSNLVSVAYLAYWATAARETCFVNVRIVLRQYEHLWGVGWGWWFAGHQSHTSAKPPSSSGENSTPLAFGNSHSDGTRLAFGNSHSDGTLSMCRRRFESAWGYLPS